MPYLIEYRVKGAGWFPTDMLRYNNAKSRNSDDAASIHASPHDWPGQREVELVRCVPNLTAAKFMAEGRWISFGWAIILANKPFHVPRERLREFSFDPVTLRPLEPEWGDHVSH